MTRSAIHHLKSLSKYYSQRVIIVGKGPSSSEWDATNYNNYLKIGINEASNKDGIDFAFSIDANNFSNLNISSVTPLLTCLYPNDEQRVGNLSLYKPNGKSIFHHFNENFYIFNLNEDVDELYGERLSAGKFSSSILIELLAISGFTDITLCGIDGGTKRGQDFAHLHTKEMNTIHTSYSEQFTDILRIKKAYPKLNIKSFRSSKNTILIGAEREQLLAEEVLKFSIDDRTFLNIDYVKPLINQEKDLYAEQVAGTPFSFQRFQMPELADYEGRGVYFDSDMQVFSDVYALFNHDMQKKSIVNCFATEGRAPQYSVFLAELSKITWNLEEIINNHSSKIWSYNDIMKDFIFEAEKMASLDYTWNSLEYFEPGRTCNIHYTDMGVQPWLSIYNPRSDLWVRELCRGVERSDSVARAFEMSIENGWVRPSLRYQVEKQHYNPWTLPRHVRRWDSDWVPPHLSSRFNGSMTMQQKLKWTLASHARRLMQSSSYRRAQKVKSALKKIL